VIRLHEFVCETRAGSYVEKVIQPLELYASVEGIIALTACNSEQDERALALLHAWFSPHVAVAELVNSTGISASLGCCSATSFVSWLRRRMAMSSSNGKPTAAPTFARCDKK